MTQSSNNINKSLGFIIGVPVILLILSVFLMKPVQEPVFLAEVNKYFNQLPDPYKPVVDSLMNNNISEESARIIKNGFGHFFSEGISHRELVLVKVKPTKSELNNDFQVDVYVSAKRLPLKMALSNNALIYRYKGQVYGVYKMKLPLINIDSISILQKTSNPKIKGWTTTVKPDFTAINIKAPDLLSNVETKQLANPLRPLLNKALNDHDILHQHIGYSQRNDSIFEVYNQELSTSSNTTLLITQKKAFWSVLQKRNSNFEKHIEFKGSNVKRAKEKLTQYQDKILDFEEVFDVDKWATYFAILKLFTNSCNKEPLIMIFNEANEKLEPYFSHDNCVGGNYSFIDKPMIKDANFIRSYVEKMMAFSELNFDEIISNDKTVVNTIRWINGVHPDKVFDIDYLAINQLKIKKHLDQSTVLKPELIFIKDQRMAITVHNVSYFPVQVVGLNHKEKKPIVDLNPQREILSGKKDTIQIDLPRSFENLFVSKKKKTTGFLMHKHIYDLKLSYRTLGEDRIRYAAIIPYQEKEAVAEDLFRSDKAWTKHPDMIFNEQQKTLTFKKDSVVIDQPLMLPAGYIFKPKAGTTINIVDGGKIISYSSFEFLGTKAKPIKIVSSDKKGQGILVISTREPSVLRRVNIEYLTNPKHGSWSVTGAVTFYESPVSLSHVNISNNRCEDALNIVRTNFTMSQCGIINTQSDAFDGDFVTGIISDSRFENLGNDAIDVSGSDLTIKNVVVNDAGDKGLSAGEDSKMTVTDVQISNSEIGVAGKDLSIVDIKRIVIKDTKLGFTAFKKKPEFGPSSITVINHQLENLEMNYLIESSSSLIVNGEKIETTQNVKDRMYGVEFGVSSAETRKSNNL